MEIVFLHICNMKRQAENNIQLKGRESIWVYMAG